MSEDAAPAAVTVHLARGRERPVEQGHPWIFSGAVDRVDAPGDAPAPPLARVVAADGRPLGLGLWSPRSQIRVRLLERGDVAPAAVDRTFFAHRLERALALRAATVPDGTTGYRVVNAEGDGLPGWVVDRYGDVLVSQISAAGLEALSAPAYAALADAFPEATLVQSDAVPARRAEGLATGGVRRVPLPAPGPDDVPPDEPPPDEAPFTESGLAFFAEIAGGQKTGFYLDQRDARRRVGELAGGRRVLDLFAHSGAFAVHALAGGATSVAAVESAPRLAERARRHVEANRLPADRLDWTTADVFDDLRRRDERYDLVVVDPPPFARRRRDAERAARAYKDLNRLALARTAAGGFYLTFSCSGAIDAKLLRQVLFAAATEAGRELQLLAPLAAAPDHPVAATHPEGEYLRGWLGRVL